MTSSFLHSGLRNSPHEKPVRARRMFSALLLGLFLLLPGTPIQAETQYWIYTVRPGDNIWDLTRKYCVSVGYWQHIQRLNSVRLDRQIPPGTKLRFPLDILKYQPATALVAQVRGTAQLFRADDTSAVTLKAKTSLRNGDRIVTQPGANVTLHFADGSELLVLEDSEVVMDTLSAWGATGMVDTRVRLQGGRVDTRVKPSQGPGSRYQIITPAAVAAVRGTEFRVAADKDAPLTRSEVTGGTVAVGNGGRGQDIRAGFGVVSESGKPPQAPRKLLPPPDLSATAALQRELPLRFEWATLKGAQRYRFQIAPDRKFNTLVADRLAAGTNAEWADLPDGRYALRVRGIDEVGLEGLDAVRLFEVDARPFAPRPTAIPAGALLRESRPRFSWEPVKRVKSYRFELARDAQFSQIVSRQSGDRDSLRLPEALQPGDYYWRVASVAPDGDQGPFSQPRNFTFRPLIKAPALVADPVVKYSKLVFDWKAVDHASGYRMQLAEDPEFTRMIADRRVTEPHAEVKRPISSTYYLRIRAENAQAETSPYTEAREFTVPPRHYWGLLLLLLPAILIL